MDTLDHQDVKWFARYWSTDINVIPAQEKRPRG
jgi:hypothetical protein